MAPTPPPARYRVTGPQGPVSGFSIAGTPAVRPDAEGCFALSALQAAGLQEAGLTLELVNEPAPPAPKAVELTKKERETVIADLAKARELKPDELPADDVAAALEAARQAKAEAAERG